MMEFSMEFSILQLFVLLFSTHRSLDGDLASLFEEEVGSSVENWLRNQFVNFDDVRVWVGGHRQSWFWDNGDELGK